MNTEQKNGNCPRFLQFLEETISTAGEIRLVQEFFGYCLQPENHLGKALVLSGTGCNGKSVLASVLVGMLGGGNCIRMDFLELDDAFARAGLEDKKLAVFTGLPPVDTEMACLKAIISGDRITADREDGSVFVFEPGCKLVFITNHYPEMPESMERRLLVASFRRSFYEDGDPGLSDKLKKELAGIREWAGEGLRRLSENGDFQAVEKKG